MKLMVPSAFAQGDYLRDDEAFGADAAGFEDFETESLSVRNISSRHRASSAMASPRASGSLSQAAEAQQVEPILLFSKRKFERHQII